MAIENNWPVGNPINVDSGTLKNSMKNLNNPYKIMNRKNNVPFLSFLSFKLNSMKKIIKFLRDSYI